MKKILLILLMLLWAGGALAETLGRTTIGGDYYGMDNNAVMTYKLSMADTGTVSKFTIYVNCPYSSARSAKALIYSDSGGLPSSLLAVSSGVSLPLALGWTDISISYAMTPGTYWLGVITNGGDQCNFYGSETGAAGSSWFISDSYASPANPIVTTGGYNSAREYSKYATYTIGGGSSTTSPLIVIED